MTGEEALARAEATEGYESYLWCLVAIDLDEGEAEAQRAAMEEVDLVAPEDVTLAHFQLACWCAHGIHVAKDAALAREHLLAALGGAKLRLAKDLARAIEQVRDHIGLPEPLDLERAFGPAMPNTPGNVNPAQPALATAAPKRPAKPLAPTEDVYATTATPDGRFVISGGVCGELLVWDVATRTAIRRCKNAGGSVVDRLEVAPDGKRVLIGSSDSLWIRILDLEANDFTLLKGHKHGTEAVAWLAGATRMVSADHGGALWLWEAGKPIAKAKTAGKSVWSIAVNHDGSEVVLGEGDHRMHVYALPSLAHLRVLDCHTHLIHTLAFDPAGERLLSASRDDMIGLWSYASGELVHLLSGHSDGVYAARFVGANDALSVGLDGRVLRWDLATGSHRQLAKQKATHSLTVVGNLAVTGGDDGLQFFDL